MTTRPGNRSTFSTGSLTNFFTIARFGPDTLATFGLLTCLTVVLYYLGAWYLSLAVVGTIVVIFCVESTETISLSRAEYRKIVGAKCLVLQSASAEKRGIVRLYNTNGSLDLELWSTEVSKSPANEGEVATVTGMSSMILEIALQ